MHTGNSLQISKPLGIFSILQTLLVFTYIQHITYLFFGQISTRCQQSTQFSKEPKCFVFIVLTVSPLVAEKTFCLKLSTHIASLSDSCPHFTASQLQVQATIIFTKHPFSVILIFYNLYAIAVVELKGNPRKSLSTCVNRQKWLFDSKWPTSC